MQVTARQTIRELFNSKIADNRLVSEFNLFDSSVNQKLWSTEEYYRDIITLDINEFRVLPSASGTLSSGLRPGEYTSTTGEYKIVDDVWFFREVNRLLDGFFMNSMSILDTLAHEIFTLYTSRHMQSDKYIGTAVKMLLEDHPDCATGKLLRNRLKQDWFTEFEPYRHCTTHESLIPYDIDHKRDPLNDRYYLTKPIILPDDPRSIPVTYGKNRVVNDFCKSTLENIQSLVADVYDSVLSDIRSHGDVLPIPIL